MKFETSAALLLAMAGVVTARPDAVRLYTKKALRGSAKFRREVPQEHSHEKFLSGVEAALNLNNVDQVQAAVFGLLGNAAAAAGAGAVEDLDCLQQRIADQAFTNAKAAGDVEGMTNALLFRALERNTGTIGLASVLCTSETAANPEIAAIQQHQDPASEGAAELNKQIVLDLAVQLASIGADPQIALESGTFAPGDLNDATAAGNTCDVADDPVGCIFTQNLLVEDAAAAEIDAAVAAAGGAAGADAGADAGNAADDQCEDEDDAAADDNAADEEGDAAGNADAGNSTTATPTAGANVNAFTGSVGAPPIPVTSSDAERPFEVNGDTFLNLGAAVQRACDVQKNQCANAVNGGSGDAAGATSVADCDAQQQQCVAQNAKRRRHLGRIY